MIIGTYNTADLMFIGFFDRCLFKHNDDSGGYVFKDKDGKKVFFTRSEIKKAIKQEKKKNEKEQRI